MGLTISLIIKSNRPIVASLTEFVQANPSFLMDVCDALDERGTLGFMVSGFGQNPWPVDVKTDLPIFLVQFPDVFRGVQDGIEVALEFYGQGIERRLTFSPDRDSVHIHCLSGTSWIPVPDKILMSKQELIGMMESFASNFMRILGENFSNPSESRGLREWQSGFSAKNE